MLTLRQAQIKHLLKKFRAMGQSDAYPDRKGV